MLKQFEGTENRRIAVQWVSQIINPINTKKKTEIFPHSVLMGFVCVCVCVYRGMSPIVGSFFLKKLLLNLEKSHKTFQITSLTLFD